MDEISFLLKEAKQGNRDAEALLVNRFEPLLKNLAKQDGFIDEDCKQHLTIELLLAIRRFDLDRYFKTAI